MAPTEPHRPQTPEGPSAVPQNYYSELSTTARPSVCQPHFLTGEFQTHSLGQNYLVHLPLPLALAYLPHQPGPAMIPQPGGGRVLNKVPGTPVRGG